ncbi:MAG: hypothetical protein WKF94_00025 [Solirubrobacteraceae bacterium]
MDEESATAGEEVVAALERTLRRGSARIELQNQFSPKDMLDGANREASSNSKSTRSRDGSRWRRLKRRCWDVMLPHLLSGIMRLAVRWMHKIGAPYAVATGVIEFGAHRCMYGYPGEPEAVMVSGDRSWNGTSGSAVDSLSAGKAPVEQPLWLFDLVRGVVEARELPGVDREGGRSRRFSAVADLNRVAEAVGHNVRLPTGTMWLADLKRIPVEVWVDDDGYIRRIRLREGPDDALAHSSRWSSTLELSEFGIELEVDWSRLSTLPTGPRTP